MTAPTYDESQHFLEATASRRAELRQQVDDASGRLAKRRAIEASAGTDDAGIVDRIEQLGFNGDSIRVLDLLPLIHVAWADGRVQRSERALILAVVEQRGIAPRSDASLLIEALLEARPSETFLAESLALLVDLAGKTGANKDDLVDLCVKVAEAGGGLMSFGAKTTDAERALIGDVARALGDGAQSRFRERFG
jgi:uncharacterized tellurite resistance protein B-like protein